MIEWIIRRSVANRFLVMIGGMITAPLLSLFIIPAAYKLIWLRRHKKSVS